MILDFYKKNVSSIQRRWVTVNTHTHTHTHTQGKHVMVGMWRNWDLYAHLVGIFNDVAAVKNRMEGPQEMTNRNTI